MTDHDAHVRRGDLDPACGECGAVSEQRAADYAMLAEIYRRRSNHEGAMAGAIIALLADRAALVGRLAAVEAERDEWHETARGARREIVAAMDDLDALHAHADRAEAALAAERAKVAAGLALHSRSALGDWCRNCGETMPCRTVRAALGGGETP